MNNKKYLVVSIKSIAASYKKDAISLFSKIVI